MKRCLAIIMLAVYLFVGGVPAYAALTCRCAASEVRTELGCCSHCNHDRSVAQGREHVGSPCCDDLHNTEVDLYTGSSQDSKRLMAADLVYALVVESVVSVGAAPVFCGYIVQRNILSAVHFYFSSCGLRAPPVLV